MNSLPVVTGEFIKFLSKSIMTVAKLLRQFWYKGYVCFLEKCAVISSDSLYIFLYSTEKYVQQYWVHSMHFKDVLNHSHTVLTDVDWSWRVHRRCGECTHNALALHSSARLSKILRRQRQFINLDQNSVAFFWTVKFKYRMYVDENPKLIRPQFCAVDDGERSHTKQSLTTWCLLKPWRATSLSRHRASALMQMIVWMGSKSWKTHGLALPWHKVTKGANCRQNTRHCWNW